MKMNFKPALAAALLSGSAAPAAVWADDAPKAAPGTVAGVLEASGITESGYIAASYYHSNGYNAFHQFDVQHDTLQLDQAAMTLAYQPKEGFGALVNLAAGEDMKILHAIEDGNSNSFDIVQGFIQYAAGPLTVIGGKYVTLVGAEVIAPTGNTQFSRSLLFFAEPLTHTGVRATYAISETFSLVGGVNNGWNTTSTSYGAKTGEFGILWTPKKGFSLTAQGYVGKALPFDAQKILLDVVATYNATDALTLVLSYDWGKQKQHAMGASDLTWTGAAGYANYALSEQFRTSIRLAYLDDKDGFNTGTKQQLKEATLTIGYDPTKTFELRIEARYDLGNKATPTFVRKLGTNPTLANSQSEIAVQGVLKF